MTNYAITTSDRQGRTVTGSAVWTRVYLRRVAVFDFVIAMVSSTQALWNDRTVWYAMRKQRALGRFMTAVVTVGNESEVPQELSTTGLGCASPYVRARSAGFSDCGLGAEIVAPIWGGLRV